MVLAICCEENCCNYERSDNAKEANMSATESQREMIEFSSDSQENQVYPKEIEMFMEK